MNKHVPKIGLVSLGCPKALVDSERIITQLRAEGYVMSPGYDDADVVIVNTCGFLDSAKAESLAAIGEAMEENGRVIVTGCMGVEADTIMKAHPGVLAVTGPQQYEQVVGAVHKAIPPVHDPKMDLVPPQGLHLTPKHYAYLKISEGCDRTCTFCSIPSMRGKHVTKPIEMILDEARELVDDGVRELILVAQDTTYYGMDLYGEVRLTQLLRELEQVEGIDWIRLMYLYPINFTDELIQTIADSSVIIPYLDMPLQHINSQVLKRMQRRVDSKQTRELVHKLRERIPNVVLRTTFITGFPGETDQQFAELRDFVQEMRFERMGVFTYSLEPGTPAVKLDGHLPEDVKEARRDELMSLQQEIAFEHAEAFIGYELDVLIDQELEDGVYVGRSFADAPEIDASVIVTGAELQPGDLVPVEILQREDYDLVGIVSLEESEPEE